MTRQAYARAVNRRLNLPKEIHRRVMRDFAGDIDARLEAGMTWEAVMAELGSPRQAAAELNEQMKEYTYRKSPWRYLFAVAAVLSACYLVLYAILRKFGMLLNTLQWSFLPKESASIGIIGGADGPTSIFVTGTVSTGPDWEMLLVGLILLGSLAAYLRLRKCGNK